MRVSRLYLPQALHSATMLTLEDERAHYLLHVLRLKPGAPLVVFNGEGGEYQATLIQADKRHAQLEVGAYVERDVESPLPIIIAQGISRGERMDYTLQKAVELGVAGIMPLITERTVVQLKGDKLEKRRSHWQAVVNSACEQSGRTRAPQVVEIQTFTDWLQHLPQAGMRLVLHHRAAQGLKSLPSPLGPVTLLIGPEGGLSAAELDQAQQAGFTPLCLGARVLRTETAAVAALAALQTLWGDFG